MRSTNTHNNRGYHSKSERFIGYIKMRIFRSRAFKTLVIFDHEMEIKNTNSLESLGYVFILK